MCRRSLAISHLLFADDNLFFFQAFTSKGESMIYILDLYEKALSHAINFVKSNVFYNSNVSAEHFGCVGCP